jgi:hypothetical protein
VASRIVEAGGGYKGTGNESRGLGVEKWKAAEDELIGALVDTAVRPLVASAASSERTARGLQAAHFRGGSIGPPRSLRAKSKTQGSVLGPYPESSQILESGFTACMTLAGKGECA